MRLRTGTATDVGRVRDLNEDAFLVRPERGLFVVCDGMGGAPAGEVASQVAVDAILHELTAADSLPRRSAERAKAAPSPADGDGYLPQTARLAEAVRRSNLMIYERSESDPLQAGMGTTVVGASVAASIASVAHVGDSRAYVWHEGRLELITRDHSLAEAYAQAGALEAGEKLAAEHEGVLVRVLGREPDVEVDLNEVPLQAGDYLLLCSDGLTRMVPDNVIADAIARWRSPQRICDDLVARANHNGGADNITVVVVEVLSGWKERLSNASNYVASAFRRTVSRVVSAVRRTESGVGVRLQADGGVGCQS
jgi:PPM family protein phosphatase